MPFTPRNISHYRSSQRQASKFSMLLSYGWHSAMFFSLAASLHDIDHELVVHWKFAVGAHFHFTVLQVGRNVYMPSIHQQSTPKATEGSSLHRRSNLPCTFETVLLLMILSFFSLPIARSVSSCQREGAKPPRKSSTKEEKIEMSVEIALLFNCITW